MKRSEQTEAEDLTNPLLYNFLEKIVDFGKIPEYLYWYDCAYYFVESHSDRFYFKHKKEYMYITAESSLVEEAMKIYKDKEKLFKKVKERRIF